MSALSAESLKSTGRSSAKKKEALERIEKKIDMPLKNARRGGVLKARQDKNGDCKGRQNSENGGTVSLSSYLDLEKPIRILDSCDNRTVIFLGKVGVGISPEHLAANEFSKYDYVFIMLDD